MLGEPPPTEYDLKFEFFGVPVRVHPFFWLISILLGIRGTPSAAEVVIWVAVVFVSILVHEFGHAWVIRYFGWSPRIVLYSFGGLAIYDPSFAPWQSGGRPTHSSAKQIMISLAGPGAGFLLAFAVVFLLFLSNRYAGSFPVLGFSIPLGRASSPIISNENLWFLIIQLMYVNIFWGLLNLMPVYPLDGGKVARELFLENTNDGVRKSLQLSMATAVVLAVFCLMIYGSMFMALMFGYFAFQNYQQLSGPFGGYPRW